jgi:hypothetical protein
MIPRDRGEPLAAVWRTPKMNDTVLESMKWSLGI